MLHNIGRSPGQKLEKRLSSKVTKLLPQNLTIHRAVLAFKLQESKQLGIVEHFSFSFLSVCRSSGAARGTRGDMSFVARTFAMKGTRID